MRRKRKPSERLVFVRKVAPSWNITAGLPSSAAFR
jgi:hypothetical protein